MLKRIERLTEKVLAGKQYIAGVDTEFDREDIFLPPIAMHAKQAKEYILNQKPFLSEDTALTGFLRFADNVLGDVFWRFGHENYWKVESRFYCKPTDDGLCTLEFQHSVADFEKVIRVGMDGLKAEIAQSKQQHTGQEEILFLEALDTIVDAIIGWANKCADAAAAFAEQTDSKEAKKNMRKLSTALRNVPQKPAKTFYEAILTVYVIYAFVPDSIGCIDRYLYPFYEKDIADGSLTKEDAKAYLQELFLMLQAKESIEGNLFHRGGQSHFCVGGYLENGEDGFSELSKLVVDALMELPTWIPQVSLRWTKKTPPEVLRYMLDCERKDKNKRIAFVNDEPRIKAFTELGGFPFSFACNYTMVGCNEPQLPGGIIMGGCDVNIVKAMENTLYQRKDDICNAATFSEFYAIFEQELFDVLTRAVSYHNKFLSVRARDVNLVSTMFFTGSIERAKSITQGGAANTIADITMIGIVTVIDSLANIKKLVFDEQKYSMQTLLEALSANWNGYEAIRADILKSGSFFGNDDECSNTCADLFANSIEAYFEDKRSDMGYRYMTGNLIGYHQHNKWFGERTKATPDGRYDKDAVSFGIGQSEGKDKEGLTALLSSVAKMNSHLILCGDTVTNITLDEQLVKQDANFEKLVKVFETYFRMGGLHFQLTYVSREDLIKAKETPAQYRNIRVRVSGFSEYFVLLNEDLQDDVIARTQIKR